MVTQRGPRAYTLRQHTHTQNVHPHSPTQSPAGPANRHVWTHSQRSGRTHGHSCRRPPIGVLQTMYSVDHRPDTAMHSGTPTCTHTPPFVGSHRRTCLDTNRYGDPLTHKHSTDGSVINPYIHMDTQTRTRTQMCRDPKNVPGMTHVDRHINKKIHNRGI